ncbi:helix-turn-helix domain-containing protein [Nocardioides sp.]|uniref:TetR/AcrR family transcriptional regulator n=1 Tax=Nocardioides sp. TaxID=35761 RepID=UPI002B26C5B1|nr:helix-turn-helix domain-containing protein [Nocardioides sp.]
MPRNRRPQDRSEKLDEIVTAAARLFSEAGFEQTSMARIAQAAGVTPTTIYWYVDDKDALLVAALDHLLADALEEFDQQAGAPLIDQVLWALERLSRHRTLIGVVHARSEHASVVATWHDGFHALMDSLVTAHLDKQGVPEPDRTAAARLTTFAVEGLLSHPTSAAETRAVLDIVLSR